MNIIRGRYRVDFMIGNGSFGNVYKGENIRTQEIVAIKFERFNHGMLKHETSILNYLCRQGVMNIPNIRWYGMANEYNGGSLTHCLIIPFYTMSLLSYLNTIDPIIYRKCAIDFMTSTIATLSVIHDNYVIHRDIKPDNLMVRNNRVIIIDFGISTIYMDNDGFHYPENKVIKTDIVGSSKYISPNIHYGIDPSRRDDMISLGYVFMEIISQKSLWKNHGEYNNTPFPETYSMTSEQGLRNACFTQQISTFATSSQSPEAIGREDNNNSINSFRNQTLLSKKTLDNLRIILFNAKYDVMFEYFSKCYDMKYDEYPNYKTLMTVISR